jgi:hypothetical protein
LGWVRHLEKAGFCTKVLETKDLDAVKKRLGVPDDLAACHTAEVASYIIEGHVPAAALKRFLAEKPTRVDLGLAGMRPIVRPQELRSVRDDCLHSQKFSVANQWAERS